MSSSDKSVDASTKAKLLALRSAIAAQERAHAPYSNYKVGCSLLCDDGSIHNGCNVENAAYLGTHAEQGAVAAMVNSGQSRTITCIVIVGSGDKPTTPCGLCRQSLIEFAPPNTPVRIARPDGTIALECTLGTLLPSAFTI